MYTIFYPDNLDDKFYEKTIRLYQNIILDGFYYGRHNADYKKSRVELSSNYKLIYMCDDWLDSFCWQDYYSFYRVPDKRILGLIEKYYDTPIPFGCLAIAVKHRNEKIYMAEDLKGFDLIFKKKAFGDYLELHDN